MYAYEIKVDQSGMIRCPICKNQIAWSYKMEAMMMSNGKMATSHEAKPNRAVTPCFTKKGKVYFIIGCEICTSCIETGEMDLIKGDSD